MNWRRYAPGILWTVLIAVLCSMPGSSLPKVGWLEHLSFDKIVHFFLFLIWGLCILWALEYKRTVKAGFPIFLIVFLSAALYGAVLEALQFAFINERSAEWADWVADCCGAPAGIWFWTKYRIQFLSKFGG